MDTANEVRLLLLKYLPGGTDPATLGDDLRLGSDGAGLDSISMVELLLDCEARFGIAVHERILMDGALTLGSLIQTVAAAMTMRPDP